MRFQQICYVVSSPTDSKGVSDYGLGILNVANILILGEKNVLIQKLKMLEIIRILIWIIVGYAGYFFISKFFPYLFTALSITIIFCAALLLEIFNSLDILLATTSIAQAILIALVPILVASFLFRFFWKIWQSERSIAELGKIGQWVLKGIYVFLMLNLFLHRFNLVNFLSSYDIWPLLTEILIPITIPISIALLGLFQYKNRLKFEEENNKRSIFNNCITEISEILISHKENLDDINLSDIEINIIRARVLTAFTLLYKDGEKKMEIIYFLMEWNIFQRINLRGANLSYTNFNFKDLSNIDLSHVNLKGATFFRSILVRANLSNSNLISANFSQANLHGANLKGAILTDTYFGCFLWGKYESKRFGFPSKIGIAKKSFKKHGYLQRGGANLDQANFKNTAVEIDQVMEGINWEKAIYDDNLMAFINPALEQESENV